MHLSKDFAEPITVDAVIEYLRDKGLGGTQERQDESEDQDDASSAGKWTEYYFAWVCGASGILIHGTDA